MTIIGEKLNSTMNNFQVDYPITRTQLCLTHWKILITLFNYDDQLSFSCSYSSFPQMISILFLNIYILSLHDISFCSCFCIKCLLLSKFLCLIYFGYRSAFAPPSLVDNNGCCCEWWINNVFSLHLALKLSKWSTNSHSSISCNTHNFQSWWRLHKSCKQSHKNKHCKW